MVENHQYRLKKSEIQKCDSLPLAIKKVLGNGGLRWYISEINDSEVVVEASICDALPNPFLRTVSDRFYPGRSVALNIIPTGVGCHFGGFAGDAAPVTNLLASAVDYLVTNPNAVNASNFISLDKNVVYTEGSTIDLFCQGLVDLHLPRANRIGLVIDQSDEQDLEVIFNVVNAVRATHGVDIVDYVITDEPIGGRSTQNESGAYLGTIDNSQVLFNACENLISLGANAIAITTNIQDLAPEDYAKHFAGEYPNPVGGVEAVISHLITRRFQLPAAHAPLINMKQIELIDNIVDARGAGEIASTSGLACVLIGLQRAPQIQPRAGDNFSDIFNLNNLLAVIAPASCLGGLPILETESLGIPVIAVEENETILGVTQDKLNLNHVIPVRSYTEATGILVALQRGLSIDSISRPLETLRPATSYRLTSSPTVNMNSLRSGSLERQSSNI